MIATERKPLLLDFEKPLFELESRIEKIRELAAENDIDVAEQIRQLEGRAMQLRQGIFSSLSPSQKLQLARHPRRPSTLDYIKAMSDAWMELHGDRCGTNDSALIGGVARLAGRTVVMLGWRRS